MKRFAGPVYPIIPSYNKDESLDIQSIEKYIEFLKNFNAKTIMTTAGTTQFNLLSNQEIFEINDACANSFPDEKILGLPSLSLRHLKDEIESLNKQNYSKTSIMILYPERYYYDEEIIAFYHEVADISIYPVMVHGMFMRNGRGGAYNYSANLYNEIIEHKNIIGSKEETSDISLGYEVLSKISDPNFELIVAGGSQRRYWHLGAVGASTFLTGVGSVFPVVDEAFYKAYQTKNFDLCFYILNEYENPFFDVFMRIGWHPALRFAMNCYGFCKFNRKPYVLLKQYESEAIVNILKKVEKKLNDDKRMDIGAL
ncbi:MAG: dihydrodipicolinate synthase family protein [Spirochaetota bacterium]